MENSEATKKHTAERLFYYLYFDLYRCSIVTGLLILSLQKYTPRALHLVPPELPLVLAFSLVSFSAPLLILSAPDKLI